MGSFRPELRAQAFTRRIMGLRTGCSVSMERTKAALKVPLVIVLMSTAMPTKTGGGMNAGRVQEGWHIWSGQDSSESGLGDSHLRRRE